MKFSQITNTPTMAFVRLCFKDVNGDERTHKVPGNAVPDYEALISYIRKYLDREEHLDEVHIHTNSGPCREDTLVYADNYNTGCFQCENAGEAPPLHVHLLPRQYVRVPILPSDSIKPCYYADDLSIQAIKRITNNNNERVVVGRVQRSPAAVYAVMCRDNSIKYFQTDRDLNGKHVDGKVSPIPVKKINFFRDATERATRKRLRFRKEAAEQKSLQTLSTANAERAGKATDRAGMSAMGGAGMSAQQIQTRLQQQQTATAQEDSISGDGGGPLQNQQEYMASLIRPQQILAASENGERLTLQLKGFGGSDTANTSSFSSEREAAGTIEQQQARAM